LVVRIRTIPTLQFVPDVKCTLERKAKKAHVFSCFLTGGQLRTNTPAGGYPGRKRKVVKLKTVSVTYGRKFNLGDYNSATVDCTLWADLDEGDNEADAMAALWEMAKNNVKAQALPLVQKQSANVEQIFMGLPMQVRNELKEK
jgi:hypothetical protein